MCVPSSGPCPGGYVCATATTCGNTCFDADGVTPDAALCATGTCQPDGTCM